MYVYYYLLADIVGIFIRIEQGNADISYELGRLSVYEELINSKFIPYGEHKVVHDMCKRMIEIISKLPLKE